jgi:hypothetical protein
MKRLAVHAADIHCFDVCVAAAGVHVAVDVRVRCRIVNARYKIKTLDEYEIQCVMIVIRAKGRS